MSNYYILSVILVMGMVTFLLRALPFAFEKKLTMNGFAIYIRQRFPLVMMFILVIYSSGMIKMHQIQQSIHFIIPALLITAVHLMLRNVLLSITLGVVSYVLILHFWP